MTNEYEALHSSDPNNSNPKDGRRKSVLDNLPTAKQIKRPCRYFLPIFLIIILVLVTIDSSTTQYTLEFIVELADYLQERNIVSLTAILFIFGFFSPIVGFPFTFFPLLCSFIYNQKLHDVAAAMFVGTLLSITAPVLGGLVCFWVSRFFFREDPVDHEKSTKQNKNKKRYALFLAVDSLFEDSHESVKIQVLMRLSPLVNASLMNYGLGVMQHCTTSDMLIANVLGSLPYAAIWCYFGSAVGEASDLDNQDNIDALSLSSTTGLVTFVLGIVFTLLATILITKHTARKLKEYFEKHNSQERERGGRMQSPLLRPDGSEGGGGGGG